MKRHHAMNTTTDDLPATDATHVSGDGINMATGAVVVAVLVILSASVVSIVGNILVCIVIHRSRRLQSTTNYYITSLALCDLLVTLGVMPFVTAEVIENQWPFGYVLCKIVRCLQYWMLGTAMWILTGISEDRYYTIIYPLSPRIRHSRTMRLIAVCFVVTCLLSLPTLYLHGLDTIEGVQYCSSVYFNSDDSLLGKVLIPLYLLLVFFAPITAITCSYVRLFRYIWEPGHAGRTLQRTVNSVPRSKVTMLKMIIKTSCVVTALLLPFVACHLWYLSLSGGSTVTSHYTYLAATILHLLSCSAKPGKNLVCFAFL